MSGRAIFSFSRQAMPVTEALWSAHRKKEKGLPLDFIQFFMKNTRSTIKEIDPGEEAYLQTITGNNVESPKVIVILEKSYTS